MSSKDKVDTWETQSGLPDDFDYFITSAAFGFREEYQNGETPLLIWEGESPDEDVPSIIWPLGKGWEVVNEGRNVQHPRRRLFITTSFVGRLIDRVVKELGVDMRSRGPATDANVWVGLGFHMKREEVSFGEGILEDRGGKTTHLMPTAVLKGAKKAKKADDVEAKPSPLLPKLTSLAKSLDRDKFQKAAMAIQGLDDDPDLLANVLDDSTNGFWAKNHK